MITARARKWEPLSFLLILLLSKITASTTVDPLRLPSLFDEYMACSNEKIFLDFSGCVNDRLEVACNNDRPCLIRNIQLMKVHIFTGRLLQCAKFKTKCSSDDFKKLENTLNESAKSNCKKSDCTGDVDKWFDQMFPNCVRNEGFNCEPPTTTTTPIITTTIAKIAISERDREESPSSSSALQMNSMSNTSYSVHFIFVFLVVVF
ncbi:unnamed protein product [Caenorhabditis nigoni]